MVCGCSHPGITRIIEKGTQLFRKPVLFAFGGFHLDASSGEAMDGIFKAFTQLGVMGIGGSHCTGEGVRRSLRAYYGENYKEMGAGRTLTLR